MKNAIALLFLVSISGAQAIRQNGNNLSATSGVTNVSNGGTGQTSFPAGSILFGNGTSGINTTSTFTYSSGNFGIGTSSPNRLMSIVGTSGNPNGNCLTISSSSVNSRIADFCTEGVAGSWIAGSAVGDTSILNEASGGNIGFSANGGVNMHIRILNSGSVGIGTANPNSTSALTVSSGTGTSPAAVFSPVLSSGTVSPALSGTFTNTALGPCVANSTGSMVLPQVSEIRFDVHCTISVASLAAVIGAGVIVDGGFIDGESSSKGATAPQEAVSTDGTNLSFTVYASGLSAASHSYCFSPFVSANTGTIDSTNSVCHLHAHMMP